MINVYLIGHVGVSFPLSVWYFSFSHPLSLHIFTHFYDSKLFILFYVQIFY